MIYSNKYSPHLGTKSFNRFLVGGKIEQLSKQELIKASNDNGKSQNKGGSTGRSALQSATIPHTANSRFLGSGAKKVNTSGGYVYRK